MSAVFVGSDSSGGQLAADPSTSSCVGPRSVKKAITASRSQTAMPTLISLTAVSSHRFTPGRVNVAGAVAEALLGEQVVEWVWLLTGTC